MSGSCRDGRAIGEAHGRGEPVKSGCLIMPNTCAYSLPSRHWPRSSRCSGRSVRPSASPTQILLDDAQVAEDFGDVGVVGPGPGGSLADGEGGFVGGAGAAHLTLLQVDDAQVAEGYGGVGVLGPVGRLLDGQGAFQGGAGGGQLTQLRLDDAQVGEG